MSNDYEHFRQINNSRIADAQAGRVRRQAFARQRARRRLERAELQARQARLLLAAMGESSRSVQHQW